MLDIPSVNQTQSILGTTNNLSGLHSWDQCNENNFDRRVDVSPSLRLEHAITYLWLQSLHRFTCASLIPHERSNTTHFCHLFSRKPIHHHYFCHGDSVVIVSSLLIVLLDIVSSHCASSSCLSSLVNNQTQHSGIILYAALASKKSQHASVVVFGKTRHYCVISPHCLAIVSFHCASSSCWSSLVNN